MARGYVCCWVGVGPTTTAERNVMGANLLEVYRPGDASEGHLQEVLTSASSSSFPPHPCRHEKHPPLQWQHSLAR
jgi:hypothetical protein